MPAAYLKEQWFDRKRKKNFKGGQKNALKEKHHWPTFISTSPNEMSKEANIFSAYIPSSIYAQFKWIFI